MKNKVFRLLALVLTIIMVIPFGMSNVFAEDEIEGINMYYYRVVYPSGASSDTKKAVQAFGNYLNEFCGADVEVVPDVGNAPINKEIIIGNTNRPAASDVVLKEKDWCVYTDGTKIYINAYSEGALPLAIEWFKHNCLINGDKKAYVGEGYFYSHEYEFDGFRLDGIPARDLVIAYENSDHIGFVDVAYTLAYTVMERSGAQPTVASAATREQPQLIIASAMNGAKYLPSGVSVGASEYVICRSGNDIAIVADSAYGAELAAQKIIDLLYTESKIDLAKLCSNTPVKYEIGKNGLPISRGAEYRFMTFNPGRYVLNLIDRCDETLALMSYYSPDVIGFQEYCDHFSAHMTPQLSKIGYTMIGDELCKDLPENADDWLLKYNMTPIAYRTDRFECVASGWQRMQNTYNPSAGRNYRGHQITWAILKDKANGQIFGVTSTHFFHLSDRSKANPVRVENARELLALVSKLEAQYNCPFISVGDYNSYPTDEAYKVLESSAIFADSRYLATQERMITAAGHTHNKVNISGNPCIDYLFVTDEVSVVRNKIAINEITATAGDHFPVFADVTIGEQDSTHTPIIQTSKTFATFSASAFKADAANGKTTVGRNPYAPEVEVKTSAPLEEDEFWEMKNPPIDSPCVMPEKEQTPEKKKLFGCGSGIGGSALLMLALAAGSACIVKTKKERD